MKTIIKNKILFCAIFALVFIISINNVHAATYGVSIDASNNLNGYAWFSQDKFGWIKFSGGSYGVYKSGTTLNGYAWSSNAGWLSFNSSDLVGCPTAPCSANIDASNNLSGWAKFISHTITSGNNGGWVKLRGTSYGVTLGATQSYAWNGSDGFGWISFGTDTSTSSLPSCTASLSLGSSSVALGSTTTLTWNSIPESASCSLEEDGINVNLYSESWYYANAEDEIDDVRTYDKINPVIVPVNGAIGTRTYSLICTAPGYNQGNATKTLEVGSPEVCDGIDNNGNGQIDEGFYIGQFCSNGYAACAQNGTIQCTGLYGSYCNAVPDMTKATTEICDNDIDEDCNGVNETCSSSSLWWNGWTEVKP